MARILSGRPTPAMIVALVALCSSFASGATAVKLLTGKDIANKSLTGKDLKPRYQLVLPVKKGQHTYSLRLQTSAGTTTAHDARLTALFVPKSL